MGEAAEDTLALNLDGALWIPYKELYRKVNAVIYKKDESCLQEFEVTLRACKMDFIRLLKTPARNKKGRAAVEKASSDGINVVGQRGKRILTKAVVDEALILSDLFELNEIVALELLLLGESEQPRLSVPTRGLAAVLLFYEGRQCLVNSLRALIQAREGRCWTLGLSKVVVDLITKFTDDLWDADLCNQIFCHLESFDLDKERDRLENSRALGGPKHRKQVLDLIEGIRTALAECIYCWTCQSGLSRPLFVRLLNTLADVTPSQKDGLLDGAQFTLLMAAFYAVDLGMVASTEDFDERLQNFPPVADADFVAGVHGEITNVHSWKLPAMKAAIQFSWAVALRTMSQLPTFQGLGNYTMEDDEGVVDMAINGGAFNFLTTMVIGNDHFFEEEFFIRRLHTMITSFIIFMPLKVKELRNRGDEIARIRSHGEQTNEGSFPQVLHFQHFLKLVAALYSKDPLGLELNDQYWCPSDVPGQFRGPSTAFANPTQKQVNLFKFVRLAGDLVPPLLYVPYIRMLCSLSSSPMAAHHCFSLLKSNGASATGSHYGSVSFDHVFSSLHRYFLNLCQEPGVQQPQRGRGITPREVEGLASVLRLIQTIAQYDEVARIAIGCESSEWSFLAVLLGLLSCAIPLKLKAQIIDTIGSLIGSFNVAITVWQALENSNMLPTASNSGVVSTLQMELDEVESHCEEYPMTRATVELLATFVDTFQSVDSNEQKLLLRFEPCVVYIIHHVFSKFNMRPYKCAEEKWQLASACLDFFLKLASKYELDVSHFKNSSPLSGELECDHSSGGHLIISSMLQDSMLLKTILFIVDEVSRSLDQYLSNFPGKSEMEKSALLCLKLIQTALGKQDAFVSTMREATTSNMLITDLAHLLMGINPKTQRADFLLRIARFISFNSSLPEHAFYASAILLQMCHSSISQEKILGAFCPDDEDLESLRHGLVECLESDELDEDASTSSSYILEHVEDTSRMQSSTRRTILRILTYCLHHPPPNLSLYLLGFGLTKAPQKTILQDPGVLGSPFTCLHAILEILFRENSNKDYPSTSELCFELIYTLSTISDTSGPTLRYLRTSHDFLYRQLKLIPFEIWKSDQAFDDVNLLNQQTWLLKTVAVELRVTAASGQRSSLLRLVSLLIDDGDQAGPALMSTSRSKLLCILDALELSQSFPQPPEWELYDVHSLERVISSCERPTRSGFVAVDIQSLHHILSSQINSFQGALTLGQRPVMTKELNSILSYIAKRNRARLQLHSKRQALESWCLVTEMVLSTINVDFLDEFRRITIILELAHTILHKVLDESSTPELTNSASRVLPTLFSSLRQSFLPQERVSSSSNHSSWKPHLSSMEVALCSLIECILKTGVGPHKVRANYYSALLNLLKVCDTSDYGDPGEDGTGDLEGRKFLQKSMDVINSYGNSFLEILSRDACNNNDITKMLSICCLSFLVSKDHRNVLINYMASNGYIQEIVNSLKADDASMCSLENGRNVYVYETKMAFFVQLASNTHGVRHLLCCGLLKCLAEVQMFKIRSDSFKDVNSMTDQSYGEMGLDPKNSFHNILVPALKVCLLLLASPIGNLLDSRSQAIHFLVSHVDMFSAILSECHQSVLRRQEASLVVAIFANIFDAANEFLATQFSGNPPAEIQTNLSRLYRLAKSCLPALVAWKKASGSNLQQLTSDQTDEAKREETTWMEAVICMLFFCTGMVKGSGAGPSVQLQMPSLVFGPYMARNYLLDSPIPGYSARDFCRMPDLGLLVYLLQYATQKHFELSNMQLMQSLQENTRPTRQGIWHIGERTTVNHSQNFICNECYVSMLLQRSIVLWEDIMENALYLLWFHLEFYLIRGKSAGFGAAQIGIRRLQETSTSDFSNLSNSTGVVGEGSPFLPNKDDLSKLRNDCRSILTDSFMERIREVIQSSPKLRQGHFSSVMIRRLRWLAVTPDS